MLDNCTNEVAFYRRIRNHNKRVNKYGRIKPDYILTVNDKNGEGSILDIPKDKLEYAKKYSIPIIVYKSQKYKEIEKEVKNDENIK